MGTPNPNLTLAVVSVFESDSDVKSSLTPAAI